MTSAMMLHTVLILMGVFAMHSLSAADAPTSTLVISETDTTLDNFDKFFNILEEQGHNLDFISAFSPELRLRDISGALLYENAVLIVDGVEEFGGNLSAAEVVSFFDAGGNIFLITSSGHGDAVVDLASELGFDIDEAGSNVVDFERQLDSDPTLVQSYRIADVPVAIGDKRNKTFLYHGVAVSIKEENPLPFELIVGGPASYSYNLADTIEDYPFSVGRSTVLAGAIQGRNNARAVILGSIDAISNSLINDKRGDNGELISSLLRWSFGNMGKIHITWSMSTSENVFITSETTQICIVVHTNSNSADIGTLFTDIGLEIKMLDYFERHQLTTSSDEQNKLCAVVKLPNSSGTYQLSARHSRFGYSFLNNSEKVLIRNRPISGELVQMIYAFSITFLLLFGFISAIWVLTTTVEHNTKLKQN